MKYGFASIGMFFVGALAIMGVIMFTELTVSNEEDYYVLKEAMEGAMKDSIDIAYFRRTGEVKIIQEQFVENFTRRFAESINFNPDNYTIEFYDIIESPPKASIRIYDGTTSYDISGGYDKEGLQNFTVLNELTGILEYNNNTYSMIYHLGVENPTVKNFDFSDSIFNKTPKEFEGLNLKNVKIANIEYIRPFSSEENSKYTYVSDCTSDQSCWTKEHSNQRFKYGQSDLIQTPKSNNYEIATTSSVENFYYNTEKHKLGYTQNYTCNTNNCLVGVVIKVTWAFEW